MDRLDAYRKHRDFSFHYRATYTGTGDKNLCLSIRKLMSVVKDVDLEAMPTSIFLNDDDDDGKSLNTSLYWKLHLHHQQWGKCPPRNFAISNLHISSSQ